MSAYVVSKTHLDLLVTAGLRLAGWSGPLWWYDRQPTTTELEGLYQPGTALPAGATVWHEEHRRTLTAATAGRVGAMLWAENVASVNHRYAEDHLEPPYVFEPLAGTAESIDPLDVLDAIGRYQYQTCEHPGWAASEAHALCNALTKRAVDCLLDARPGPQRFTDVNNRHLWDPTGCRPRS